MVPPFGLHGSAHELRRECRLFEEALGAREKKTCFEFFPPFFSFTLFLDLRLSSKGERKKTVRNPRFPSLFFCEMRDRRKRALLRARGNKKKMRETNSNHHQTSSQGKEKTQPLSRFFLLLNLFPLSFPPLPLPLLLSPFTSSSRAPPPPRTRPPTTSKPEPRASKRKKTPRSRRP